MKHYWINIDTSIDRKNFIEKQLATKKIENFRINAETPETISLFSIIRHNDSINTPEEIACIISHLKAIKKGYEDGDEYFCVMEDDMDINNIDFTKLFKYIKNAQEKDTNKIELVQLFSNSHPFIIKMFTENTLNQNDYKEFVIKREEDCPSTGYYLISRDGAKKLLDLFQLSETYYDLSYSFWTAADNILYRPINSYILTYPVALSIIKYGSTIHPQHLGNHESANNVIKQIWTLNNQIHNLI